MELMATGRGFLVTSVISGLVIFSTLPVVALANDTAVSAQPILSSEAVELQQELKKYRSSSRAADFKRFYALRDFEPAWNGRGLSALLISHLEDSTRDGLTPADYKIEKIREASGLQQEFLLTDALLNYAKDLRDGVHTPSQVDRRWLIKKNKYDLVVPLEAAVSNRTLKQFLRDLAPPHAEYGALREQLQVHRDLAEDGGWPLFPARGPRRLDPGDQHAHIPLLRERLAGTDGAEKVAPEPLLYDDELVEAVKRFQRRHGLNEDGVIGGATRAALAVPVETRVEQIIASMERWRWMPRDLGPTYVIVDVPAYRLWFHQPGVEPLTMRTIVGDYKNQTPSFTRNMKYMVMKPNWYVPNSIASKELAPKIGDDPEYVQRAGFVVYDKESKEKVDPSSVDWQNLGTGSDFPYRLVQSSSRSNALGSIKFIFPNPHGIYLHDTSAPSLFRKDKRALSHGCVRLEKPMELASRILGKGSPEAVADMVRTSSSNRHVNLQGEIPVYLVYMTAWSEGKGDISFFHDVYKRDRRLLAAK